MKEPFEDRTKHPPAKAGTWCKILCKRNSTKSRDGAEEREHGASRIPYKPRVPASGADYVIGLKGNQSNSA